MRPNPKALRSCASSSSVQFSPEKRDLREPLSIMSLRQNPMHSLKAMSTHGHRVASSRHLPGPRDRGFDLGDENLFHPSNIPCICMKKIGFLSFGHWTPSSQSETRSAQDVLLQSIDLAIEAERLGVDGAYFRVHHFARQLSSPFPLLAAVGARMQKIEIGTAVIDMRYENPHYMAEDAGSADLIAGSRLQLGISRGSPEQVIDGWRHFGYRLADGEDDRAYFGRTGDGSQRRVESECGRLRPMQPGKRESEPLAGRGDGQNWLPRRNHPSRLRSWLRRRTRWWQSGDLPPTRSSISFEKATSSYLPCGQSQ
jgi:Luciferase-like monooxygenase